MPCTTRMPHPNFFKAVVGQQRIGPGLLKSEQKSYFVVVDDLSETVHLKCKRQEERLDNLVGKILWF